jgi:hypothetical protein
MAITDSDIRIGNIYVDKEGCYPVKVYDYVWVEVDGVDRKFWVHQMGLIWDNKFVPSKALGGVHVTSTDTFVRRYDRRWKPSPLFADGDILVAPNGEKFLVRGTEPNQKIWRLASGGPIGWASYDHWSGELGELELAQLADGQDAIAQNLA